MICWACKEDLPDEAFYIGPSSRRTNKRLTPCISCKENARILKKYGVTAKKLRKMMKKQGGKCAICRRKTKLVVDHDHRTGKVRGLLCVPCNVGLTTYELYPEATMKYLEDTT